jgi:hypothetical protein
MQDLEGHMGSKHSRRDDPKGRRLPVDPARLNMGNTYDRAPEFYDDIEFQCVDCGAEEVWTARQQKWWYEEAGGYFFSTATRCRGCRAKERARKAQARSDAGHDPIEPEQVRE